MERSYLRNLPPEVLGIIREYAQKDVYINVEIKDPEDARKGNGSVRVPGGSLSTYLEPFFLLL